MLLYGLFCVLAGIKGIHGDVTRLTGDKIQYDCENLAVNGFLKHTYCSNYIKCQEGNAGRWIGNVMCCEEGMNWFQTKTVFTCIGHPRWDECIYGRDPTAECPVLEVNDECHLHPNRFNARSYIPFIPGQGMGPPMPCADGTVFDINECSCIQGGVDCAYREFVYFTYTPGPLEFIDDSCNMIPCNPVNKPPTIDEEENALSLDKTFCYFEYPGNWKYTESKEKPDNQKFTIVLWFKQDRGNSFEAFMGIGDCEQSQNDSYISLGGGYEESGISTNSLYVFVKPEQASPLNGRVAHPEDLIYNAGEWNFLAFSYDKLFARVYLASMHDKEIKLVYQIVAEGLSMEKPKFTIGMFLNEDCSKKIHFHGNVDDVTVIGESLSGLAIQTLFMGGRTE